MLKNDYTRKVFEMVQKRDPDQPEFQQAVYEVLESLERIADDEIREQAIYETKDYFLHNPPKPYDWDFSWFGVYP